MISVDAAGELMFHCGGRSRRVSRENFAISAVLEGLFSFVFFGSQTLRASSKTTCLISHAALPPDASGRRIIVSRAGRVKNVSDRSLVVVDKWTRARLKLSSKASARGVRRLLGRKKEFRSVGAEPAQFVLQLGKGMAAIISDLF